MRVFTAFLTSLIAITVLAVVMLVVIVAPRPQGAGSSVTPSPARDSSEKLSPGITGTQKPSSTGEGAVVPSPNGSIECTIRREEASMVAPTIENMAAVSLMAVVGEMVSVDEPRWNTPDGSRPGTGRPPAEAQIYRGAAINIGSIVRAEGSAARDQVIARLLGGKVGCDEYSAGYAPSVKEGKRYLFFLNETFNVGGTRSEDLGLFAAWPIDPSTGLVETPLEGHMPIAAVVRAFDSIPPVAR